MAGAGGSRNLWGLMKTSPSSSEIRFGIDGWRARIAEGFTFSNVRRLAGGVARFLRETGMPGGPVVVGYDTRFLSAQFAKAAAQRLAGEGIRTLLSDSVCSTPALSSAVRSRSAALGLMVTASHNPYVYSGIKLKGSFGGPIYGETISRVQEAARNVSSDGAVGEPAEEDLVGPYLEVLRRRIDLERIRSARMRVLVDSMNGTGGRMIENLLAGGNVRVETLRADPDPLFGGGSPEPTRGRLEELSRRLRSGEADIGFATDGDADRVAVIGPDGRLVELHHVVPLLVEHLVRRRGLRGRIVRSVALHDTVDRVAADLGLETSETPVGFRHLCERMREGDVLLAAEESGGIGFAHHLPERDGIFSALAILEMLTVSGKTIGELVRDLSDRYGPFHFRRIDRREGVSIPRRALRELVETGSRGEGDLQVEKALWLGGAKFFFRPNGWLLIRTSETEPLIRLYAGASDPERVEAILDLGGRWVDSIGR